MTKKLTQFEPQLAMELDLDSFLNSHLSLSDEDDDDNLNSVPHRTIDEILNDSDSSASSSRPPLSTASHLIPNHHIRPPTPYQSPALNPTSPVKSGRDPIFRRVIGRSGRKGFEAVAMVAWGHENECEARGGARGCCGGLEVDAYVARGRDQIIEERRKWSFPEGSGED
ncbi:hypothetical protein ACE6H2_008095 [Prunus campanulata]